ncbi:hypothetical protein LQ953_10975 [Sphingomonas sp. IC-56]|uniref:hypothetical protein n=1 Tax=Sphingomonas sp. IC-56 TaxID=2898529 RepID=UPI001E353834|nr:hypothetical protein [Sphingomonas sp. IC-56]MCD2324536.1 hypothetical protein [Sphingomonas sp. IC-56]
MRRARPPLRDGFDRVGPFHPYVAFAGVLLLDLVIVLVVLGVVSAIGDSIEDAIWPGGFDMIRGL